MKLTNNIDKFGTVGLFLTAFCHHAVSLCSHLQLQHLDLAVLNFLAVGQYGFSKQWV
jgi:hypothetical protein